MTPLAPPPHIGVQDTAEHSHIHGGPKLYLGILAALLVLTFITVTASRIDFGSNTTNVIIAMLIASIKASLVALFFMHLRWDKLMNAVIFCSSLFFLGLFLIACYSDTAARPPIEPTNLKAAPGVVGAGVGTTPGTAAPAGQPTTSVPGASSAGAHGGAAAGTARETPTPH